MGQLFFTSLRKKYLLKNKNKTVKDFHRKILEVGPVYLPLLEKYVLS